MVLLMFICGFVFCAIFLPFERLAHKLVSAKTMVNANLAASFSFVIPFYFVLSIKDGTETILINNKSVVYQDIGGYDGFVCNVREHIATEYLGLVWLIGVLIFLFYYLLQYLWLLKQIKKQSYHICDDFWSIKFSEIKNKKQVSDVFLVGCCSISTPCTVGIRNKYIMIPSYMINAFEEKEIEFILEHEFYHIVNNDVLRNFLIMILSCLNWFNPLYYLLRKNLSEWAEIVCDREVTKNYSKEERRQYCEFIIKVLSLEEDRNKKEVFTMNFKGIRNYKRRIKEVMKQNKKNSVAGRILVVSLVFTSLFCGTAVAKEADISVHRLFSRNIDIVNSNEISVIESDAFQIEDEFKSDIEETVFVDGEGVTYTIIYNEDVPDAQEVIENQPDMKHVHKYVDVIIEKHKKNVDGSCVTKYYEGQKCKLCDDLEVGSLIRTVTDEKCTH